MNSKCKVTRHRCSANKKCYRKSLWTRKNLIKRCKVGTRKCRDNKCHKKISNSIKNRSLKNRSLKSKSPKNNLLKFNEPIKAITNNMVQKIATNISRVMSSKNIPISKPVKKRQPWR